MNPTETPKSKFQSGAQALLSLFILYHLAVIIIYPNGSSYLGRRFHASLGGYANLLGLNTTWNFFSPDPAHTMFLHYNVRFEDASGQEMKEPLEGYIPPEKEKIAMDSSTRRFLYALRFLILDTNRMKMILGPWLCRSHPGASVVSMDHILEPIPNLDLAQMSTMGQEPLQATMMSFTFRCNSSSEDEVAL